MAKEGNKENRTPIALEHIRRVLKKFDNKYLTKDGVLKRSKVIEDLDNYDKNLMAAILKDKLLYETYTFKIADVEIFELNRFIDMLRYKEYWEDSFTKFNNKIGLTVGDRYINDSSDVVLTFPYKDTVLKAGMDKEDATNTNEPFLNETLAKSEIDELLEPKIFVNANKYDKDGKTKASFITNEDNLVIKGNNLIALHSLKKRYAGKVKLIYLDPPYNTGSDSFRYNDRFNHATWLTFMKNRLEIAKELLAPNGTIWIQTDDGEINYLGVLMDSIFGRKNYINTITIKTKVSGVSGSSEGKSLRNATEFIQIYAKDKNNIMLNSVYETTPVVEYIHQYKNSGKSWKYTQVLEKLGSAKIIEKTDEYTYKYYPDAQIMSIKQFAQMHSITEDEVYQKYPEKIFRTTNAQSSVRKRVKDDLKDINNGVVSITYVPIKGKNVNRLTEVYYTGKGKNMFMFLSDRLSKIDGELKYQEKLSTLWDTIQYNNLKKEGSVDFPAGKKPEKLLSYIIKLSTNPGDLVMDFFGGSGSTAATAMKLKRKFITIEQISAQLQLIKNRLQEVIGGEQHGISKEINWQGGDSFIYTELMQKSQRYIDEVQTALTFEEVYKVYLRMKQNGDIDFRVNLNKFESFLKTGKLQILEKCKRELIKIIDKNQLYYDYSNIDDGYIRKLISDADYKFNQSFYSFNDEAGEG